MAFDLHYDELPPSSCGFTFGSASTGAAASSLGGGAGAFVFGVDAALAGFVLSVSLVEGRALYLDVNCLNP